MIGERLTTYITANERRIRIQFFDGVLIDDLFRNQVEAIAFERRIGQIGGFMRLIPKPERERLIKLGVESR